MKIFSFLFFVFCCLPAFCGSASCLPGPDQDSVRLRMRKPVEYRTGEDQLLQYFLDARRPKVALVLCGGGAKGAAHIGVLKVLEEMKVPIDMIVGTSMGAIIGGMYSMGYTANEMDTIISRLDWNFLLSDNTERRDASFRSKMMDERFLIQIPFYTIRPDRGDKSKDSPATQLPGGIVNGQNVLNLLNGLAVGYQDSIKFRDLPIPFACMATDLSTGEEVLLEEGYLPLALRASMAIPGFFSPVTLNGKVLVDGGVVNNFPVDVARKLGADIVIGVDVQNALAESDQLKSIDQVFMQLVGLVGNETYLKNVKETDIYIKPDVEGFTTFSFSKPDIDSLIVNGYKAAGEKRNELRFLADRMRNYGKGIPRLQAPKAREIAKDTFVFAQIEMRGIPEKDGRWLLRQVRLKENTKVSGQDINRAISIFSGTNAFSSVRYYIQSGEIQSGEGGRQDKLIIEFKKGPSNIFGFGARFDSEEAAALLVYLGVNTNNLYGSKWNVGGRLSYNPYGRLGYTYVFRDFPRFDMEYMFKSTDMNIYKNGENNNSISFYYNRIDMSLANRYLRNFDFQLGVRFESFNFTSILSSAPEDQIELKGQSYLSYYLNARMDDRDSKYFPTDGMYFDAGASYYHTNFHKPFDPFATLSLGIGGAVKAADRFVILPALYTRVLIGKNDPLPYRNFLGGSEPGRYLEQQIPFIGINYAEELGNSIAVLRTDFRVRMGAKNHYLYGMANYARSGKNFGNIFDSGGQGLWGVGLKYAYSTRLGPVGMNVHWSDYNKKVGVYINLGYYF